MSEKNENQEPHNHTGHCCPTTADGILQSQANQLVNMARHWITQGTHSSAASALLGTAQALLQDSGSFQCEAGIWLYTFRGEQYRTDDKAEIAVVQFEKALELAEAIYGKEHPTFAICQSNLAEGLLYAGHLERADNHLSIALQLMHRLEFGDKANGEPKIETPVKKAGHGRWYYTSVAPRDDGYTDEYLDYLKTAFLELRTKLEEVSPLHFYH